MITLCKFDQYIEVQIFWKISLFIYDNSFSFFIYSLDITFRSSEYKDTIIHIFHKFKNGEFIEYESNLILLSDVLCIPMVSISFMIISTFILTILIKIINKVLLFPNILFMYKKGYIRLWGMEMAKKWDNESGDKVLLIWFFW